MPDAQLPPEQRRASVNLVKSIQEAARSFPIIEAQPDAQAARPIPLKLNARPVEIGGRFYDGFRFTTPAKASMDLVWSFSPEHTPFQGWFILPMDGGLKVGFEDWYHAVPQKAPGEAGGKAEDFTLQFLSEKKLQSGRDYFIWFGGETNRSIELQVALRFVRPGLIDPNKPESLASELGLSQSQLRNYHRHYCLGAIR